MTPHFSVIVPSYNRSRFLARAVKSVLCQSFRDFELLVIDDASPDDTQEVLAALRHPALVSLRQAVNSGVSAARNLGVTQARGEYLVFLDDDDFFKPDALAILDAFFRNHPGIDFSWGAICHINDEGAGQFSLQQVMWPPRPDHRRRPHPLDFALRIGTSYGLAVRRTALLDLGGFDTRLKRSEDKDLFLRLAAGGYRSQPIEEMLVCYHAHSQVSLTRPKAGRLEPADDELVIRKNAGFLRRAENRALLHAYHFWIHGMYCDNGDWRGALRILRQTWAAPAVFFPMLEKFFRSFSGIETLKDRIGYRARKQRQSMRERKLLQHRSNLLEPDFGSYPSGTQSLQELERWLLSKPGG